MVSEKWTGPRMPGRARTKLNQELRNYGKKGSEGTRHYSSTHSWATSRVPGTAAGAPSGRRARHSGKSTAWAARLDQSIHRIKRAPNSPPCGRTGARNQKDAKPRLHQPEIESANPRRTRPAVRTLRAGIARPLCFRPQLQGRRTGASSTVSPGTNHQA